MLLRVGFMLQWWEETWWLRLIAGVVLVAGV